MIYEQGPKSATEMLWRSAAGQWDRLRDSLQGLPIRDLESVQIGSGPSTRFSTWAYGRDVMVLRAWVGPKSVTHITPKVGWGNICLPLAWESIFAFDGREVRPFDLRLSVGPNGFTQRLERRDAINVPFRESRLLDACWTLAGVEPGEFSLSNLAVNLGAERGTKLHATLLATLARTFGKKIGVGRYALSPIQENDIISLVARTLLPYLMEGQVSRAPTSSALEVVRAAEAAYDDAAIPPSIADLCKAAGVGEAWLHRCFVEVCGISPARFIYCRRLSDARDRLLDRKHPPRRVKDVALSLGFMGAGRFARDYRSLFGENPTETLVRAFADRARH